MRYLLSIAFVAALAWSTPADAQVELDFSGTWRMDPSRSVSAGQTVPIGPVTLVIAQTATNIRIETTRKQGTSVAIYTLDGAENTIPDGTARTRWVGPVLVTDFVRHVNGQAVTTKEARSLSADGREMHVDMTLVIQHGYSLGGTAPTGTGKDVYVRVQEK